MTLTSTFKTQVISDIKDALEVLFTYGNVGEDDTASDASDTILGLEFFRDTIDEIDKATANQITASLRLAATEGNGNTAKEVGLIDTASLAVDNCDVTTNWTDSADMTISVNSSEYKENNLALNLTKDAGASATASTYKTTTSRDFTSKKLSIWLYIVDAAALAKLATSNCFTIRFGSDSSNYYEWQKDKADLAVGWNLIQGLTSANKDSQTGTPVLASCDYTYIALTATGTAIVWSAGDFIIDDIKLTSGNLWIRNVVNDKNKTSDIQLYLDTQITIAVTEG